MTILTEILQYKSVIARLLGVDAHNPTTSTTSMTIGVGTKALVVDSDIAYPVDQWVMFLDTTTAQSNNYVVGTVDSYDAGTRTLTIDALYTEGAGTYSSWLVVQRAADRPANVFITTSGSDITSFLNAEGAVVSVPPQAVETMGGLPDADLNPQGIYTVKTLGARGLTYISDATDWGLVNGIASAFDDATPVRAVAPAVTFATFTVATANGGLHTKVSAAGTHGLTNANSVTTPVATHVYISAGTGWTPGLYAIAAIDTDSTGVSIDLDTPFASQGVPTIALVDQEITLKTISVPPLTPNGSAELESSWKLTETAPSKRLRVYLETEQLFNVNVTNSKASARCTVGFMNRGVETSQITKGVKGSISAWGSVSGDLVTSSFDTSVPTEMTVRTQIETADDPVQLEIVSLRITG